MSEAMPLGPNTYYEGDVNGDTWDEDQSYGCVCDSSWPVGLARGQRQQAGIISSSSSSSSSHY